MGKYEIVILDGGVAGIACILDHELQVPIRLGSGDKGLCPFAVSADRRIIAETGPYVVKTTRLVGDGHQPPISVAARNLEAEDRDGFTGVRARAGASPPPCASDLVMQQAHTATAI